GTKLTDAVFVALDVQHRVEHALASIPRLPPQAEFLAGPITSGVRSLIQRAVQNFLASEAFVNLWTEVNRTAHAKVKALLNGDYDQLPNVSIDGGEVRLSLVSMVAQVLQRVVQRGADGLGLNVTVPDIPAGLGSSAAVQKLGSALGVTLPADYGQVTVMTEEQLTGYQK